MKQPHECPRFHTCNSPVCPLGGDSESGVHLAGEPVCYYLLNSGKAGAAERFRDDPVFAECLERLTDIAARYPDVRRRVEVASRTGFRARHLIRKTTEAASDAACGGAPLG